MKVLWEPDGTSTMERFAARTGHADYDSLFRWSVGDLEGFWQALWDFFALRAHTPHTRVLGRARDARRGVVHGRDAQLRRAHAHRRSEIAVVARSQHPRPSELTFDELAEQVARARAGLQRLGVTKGDRVVAYLPNIPETLVAFLATREPRRDLGQRARPSSARAA